MSIQQGRQRRGRHGDARAAATEGATAARIREQAEGTLDWSKGGLGLELTLVEGLVDPRGGEVNPHSANLGKDAEFSVRLPTEQSASDEQHPAAANRKHRRVLVIEDNTDAANSLREALVLGGHEVEVAYDGRAGVAKARAFRPEIVLCDIGLPGMDGYQVAQVLRSDQAFRGTRLLALSGYALPEDVQRALDAGFEQHLAKPPSLHRLEELLAEP